MKSNLEIAKEVLQGKWGNGAERRRKLADAGYNYDDIQGIVNALLSDAPNEQYDEPVPEEESEPLKIIGTEIMEIDVNLNRYKGIKLVFNVDEEFQHE